MISAKRLFRQASAVQQAITGVPRYLLFILLAVTPLARGSVQPWAVIVIHMVTVTALTIYLLQMAWNQDWVWIRTPMDLPFLALLGYAILSAVFSVHRPSSFQAFCLMVNYIIVYYWVIHIVRRRDHLNHLVLLIIGIATVLSLLGLVKTFGGNTLSWWNYRDLPYHSIAVTSTYGNHNHLAGYLEMSIALVSGLFLKPASAGRRFALLYIGLIQSAVLILSLSRGGWIGFAGALVFMAVILLLSRRFKRKALIISMVSGCAALMLMILSSTPVVERLLTLDQSSLAPSLSSRVVIWQSVGRMIADHPVLGTGSGTFADVFTQYQPPGIDRRFFMAHNDYLHFISEMGLPMTALMMWFLFTVFKTGFRKFNTPSRLVQATTLGAMSGITAILIHSLCDFNLHIPANALVFTVLTALATAPLPLSDPPGDYVGKHRDLSAVGTGTTGYAAHTVTPDG